VAFLIIDVLIIVGAAQGPIRGLWRSWRKSRSLQIPQDRELQNESGPLDFSQEVEKLQMPSDDLPFRLNQFVKSVQRCIQLSEIGLEIGFDNLGFQIGADSKSILNGVSGVVKPGSLLAVMGASGAGKCEWILVYQLTSR
jgi:ABC-type multidrug transport system fused ATPase/permease subunit